MSSRKPQTRNPHQPTGRDSGRFVVIVGPDGVGKTSVARELLNRHSGSSGYFHFLPPRRPPLQTEPSEAAPRGKFMHPGPRPLGWIRLAKTFVLSWWGYFGSVRPALKAGHLVIGDRWAYGYLVQPIALRFAGPRWLAQTTISGMPRPDLVVNLTAPVDTILKRKGELSASELAQELAAWAELPFKPVVTLDATRTVEDIANDVEALLE